jgi:enoyl-CoA hydratase
MFSHLLDVEEIMEVSQELLKIKELDSGILSISFNRPNALNALNKEFMTSLYNTIDSAKQNKSVKAILLTGEGKAFCAGADISELAQLNSQSGMEFARFGQRICTGWRL